MKKLFILLFTIAATTAKAQHKHNGQMQGNNQAIEQLAMDTMSDMQHMHHIDMQDTAMNSGHMHMTMDMSSTPMSHSLSLNLPMNRNGSGTGWLPDASPMYGYMVHTPRWMFMFHGNLFLRYNNQDFTNKGNRGDAKVDAPNWIMAMGQRRVGKNGLFHFNIMMSADALIAGGSGYPLLFQTGESWNDQPLVDRQHPHDLFSELSVAYAHALSPKADVYAYIGYPGEPALGSVAFMHRPSALYNPDAPLSHHWVDATHITFGVATVGVRYGKFKIEGSSFTGREPDENRYNFDKPRFDSRSARLSFNPNSNWALQVSHAYIKQPEELHPGEDIYRTTASAVYALPLAGINRYFNATALWGMNKMHAHDAEHAVLAEAALTLNRLAVYGRYEWLQKSTEELNLNENIYSHDAIFPTNAFTLGAAYDLLRFAHLRLAGGTQLSLYDTDSRLHSLYGDKPMAIQVYLRLYPDLMRMMN